MPDPETLVLNSSSVPPRAGRVLVDESDRLEIEWLDGSKSTFTKRPPSLSTPEPGSVAHRFAADPSAFSAELDEAPAELFIRALREAPTDQRGADLQERLKRFVPDPEQLKAAWRKAKPVLDQHPHILRGGRPGSYRWSDDVVDPLGWVDALSLGEALGRLAATPERAETARLKGRVADLGLDAATPAQRVSAWALGLTDELTTPLGVVVHQLSEPLLALFVARLGDPLPEDVLLDVLCVPRASRTAKGVWSAVQPQRRSTVARKVLDRMVTGFREDNRTNEPLANGAALVVERLSDGAAALDAETVISAMTLVVAFAKNDPDDVEGIVAVGRLIQAPRVDLDGLRSALASLAPEPLLAAVSRLPLDRGSFRFRLLTAVLKTPDEGLLERRETWRGLDPQTLSDLIRSGHPLSVPALSSSNGPSVAESVVVEAVRHGDSAESLGAMLGWPVGMRTLIPQREFRSKLAAVRAVHPDINELLATDEMEGLQAELADARSALAATTAAAEDRERELRDELDSVVARAEWAERQMREHHGGSSEILGSQVRQAQIDALQGLAKVLDDLVVLAASESQGADLVATAWRSALIDVAGLGLAPIGRVGELIPVDPAVTQAAGPVSGTTATVVRPGYEWVHDGVRTVLRRALVVCEE